MHRIILDTRPSQRYEDSNGFLCIKDNPIAKAGVFEYSGASLGLQGTDADKLFKVYRSFDELKKTAKEFEGMPITLEHHWVEGDDRNPTVMGLISGHVYAKEPYLYADIKIINDAARNAIESGAMRELSPGYTSAFVEEPGIYNGEEYQYIQCDMHYNHLALVESGRSGPDLRIVDKSNDNGGKSMREKTFRVEDVNIDKLTSLLVDFFDEEKQEGVHNTDEDEETMPLNTDEITMSADESDDINGVIDESINEGSEEVEASDSDDIDTTISTDEDEDSGVMPSISNMNPKTQDARDIVNRALNKYKREQVKAMRAYDEVAAVVGAFKTYDTKGDMLSEESIYKTGCARLGIDRLAGISNYKSAFKAAAHMRAFENKQTHGRVTDTVEDDGTIDALIKKSFRG